MVGRVKREEKSDYGDTVDGLTRGRYHSFDPGGDTNIFGKFIDTTSPALTFFLTIKRTPYISQVAKQDTIHVCRFLGKICIKTDHR